MSSFNKKGLRESAKAKRKEIYTKLVELRNKLFMFDTVMSKIVNKLEKIEGIKSKEMIANLLTEEAKTSDLVELLYSALYKKLLNNYNLDKEENETEPNK